MRDLAAADGSNLRGRERNDCDGFAIESGEFDLVTVAALVHQK